MNELLSSDQKMYAEIIEKGKSQADGFFDGIATASIIISPQDLDFVMALYDSLYGQSTQKNQ